MDLRAQNGQPMEWRYAPASAGGGSFIPGGHGADGQRSSMLHLSLAMGLRTVMKSSQRTIELSLMAETS